MANYPIIVPQDTFYKDQTLQNEDSYQTSLN